MNSGKKILFLMLFSMLLFFFMGCTKKEKEFAFELDKNGIVYKSNVREPKPMLREFSLRQKIIIRTEIHLKKNNVNIEIFNRSVLPFYAVVAGNDKNAIQLLMFMEKGIVQKCLTNFGNLKTQVSLNQGECSALRDKWSNELMVFFPLPNPSLNRSFIELQKNRIVIRARDVREQAILSSALAEELFPNAKTILKKAHEKLEKLR